jgi:hypothetical protein
VCDIKFDGTANVAKPAFVAVPTKRLNIAVTNNVLVNSGLDV